MNDERYRELTVELLREEARRDMWHVVIQAIIGLGVWSAVIIAGWELLR